MVFFGESSIHALFNINGAQHSIRAFTSYAMPGNIENGVTPEDPRGFTLYSLD